MLPIAPITVDYELTADDLTAFNLYHHAHSATARRQYYMSWFVPAIVWLLFCTLIWYFADKDRNTPLRTFLDLLPLFSGAPIHLAIFPWLHRRKLQKTIAGMVSEGENKGLFGRRRITISEEHVVDSGDFGQNLTLWPSVERVVTANEHLFIYTHALAAIIVPRRAFSDRAEFDAFARTITDYHQRQSNR